MRILWYITPSHMSLTHYGRAWVMYWYTSALFIITSYSFYILIMLNVVSYIKFHNKCRVGGNKFLVIPFWHISNLRFKKSNTIMSLKYCPTIWRHLIWKCRKLNVSSETSKARVGQYTDVGSMVCLAEA